MSTTESKLVILGTVHVGIPRDEHLGPGTYIPARQFDNVASKGLLLCAQRRGQSAKRLKFSGDCHRTTKSTTREVKRQKLEMTLPEV